MSTSTEMNARRRRRAIRTVAPLAGLLAVGLLAWQSSYSAFSATTDNGTESWTTGQLALVNNGGTATYAGSTTAVFNDTNLKPGSTSTKCITVKSTGSIAGSLHFYRSALTDSSPSIGSQLQLTIDAAPVASDVLANCTGFPATGLTNVASAVALTSLPTTYATSTGNMAVAAGNVLVAYRLTYTLATTGTNAGDNLLMNKTATAGFTWELQ